MHTPSPLPAQTVSTLLHALSTSTQFRRVFLVDPIAALLQLGWTAPEGMTGDDPALQALRDSLRVERLAPKQSIAAAQGELQRQLTGTLAMQPIQLNVDSTAARRRLK